MQTSEVAGTGGKWASSYPLVSSSLVTLICTQFIVVGNVLMPYIHFTYYHLLIFLLVWSDRCVAVFTFSFS